MGKDKFATETFKLNFPHLLCTEKDIQNLSVHGNNLEPVDILTAGLQCHPFSVAGDKLGFQDAASDLSYSFSKAILIRGRSVNRGNRCVQQSQIDSQLSAMMGGMVED